ncbi:MAG: DUF3488 and DUF4129 domain-containing transglutaminase family protein [Phycisphaerales bacterium]
MTARAFIWLTWSICLLSVLAYSVADQRPEIALVGLAACAAAAFMTGRGMPRALPRLSINLLVIGASAWVVLQVIRTGRPEVTQMTDFLVWILLIKLFDRLRPRDEGQLLGLSVFVVIGAVLTDNGFALGLLLMVLSPMFVAAAIGLQLYSGAWAEAARRRAALPSRRDRTPDAGIDPFATLVGPGRPRRQLASVWIGSVIACGILSITAFVLSPRTLTQQVMSSFGQPRAGAQSEFRDSINLGMGGRISLSDEPVLDLTLRDETGQPIGARGEITLLRGAVLDEYDTDTRQWRSSPGPVRTIRQQRDSAIWLAGSAEPTGIKIVQQIVIRNAPQNSPLFCLWRPIEADVGDAKVAVSLHDMILRSESGGRIAYSVTSTTGWVGRPADARHIDTAAVTPRVRALALELATRADVSPLASERDPAQSRRLLIAILNHLRSNFPYDLEQEACPEGVDPVEFFLFDRRRGHCEYFAAALTCLLRSVQIPTRIVTGYAAGEYNGISGSFLVRKADAHAWVEAELRPGRWESFDATPPGSLPNQLRSSRGFLAQLRQLWDALELSWVNNVVAFDARRKIDLGEALVGQRETAGKVRRFFRDIGAWLSQTLGVGNWAGTTIALLAILTLIAGAAIGIRRAWITRAASRRRLRSAPRPDSPHERALTRMLTLLERAGVAKPLHLPPLQHARDLARTRADDAQVDIALAAERLTRCYYATRFGGAAWPEREAADALAGLESAATRRRESAPASRSPAPVPSSPSPTPVPSSPSPAPGGRGG